jgi:hypothetical protein
LVSVAAWGIYLVLSHYGIPVTEGQLAAALAVITPLVVHFVPDSLQDVARNVDVDVKDLTNLVPVVDQGFPTGKNGQFDPSPVSNQAWESNGS